MRHPLNVRAHIAALVACVGASMGGDIAIAEDEPRFWAVTGVASGDVLNLRDVPHGDSKKLAGIPPDTRGLKHLGCITPEPSLDRWMIMSKRERANAKLRWCRIEYRGMEGWVAARFLKPDR